MCLVDTPGVGSVSAANTAATRAFVPHIDAALVVLGADPPISGEELALVQEVARQVAHLVLVLNKADNHADADLQAVARFTGRVLEEKLSRPVGPILRISATDRIAGSGPPRDWDALVAVLASLARDSGADLVRAAEGWGAAALGECLLRELGEQDAALRRPVEESRARIRRLECAVANAERALDDLGYRLIGVQERLSRRFIDERDRFFARTVPEAQRELRDMIRAEHARGPVLRKRAMDDATDVAWRWLERWRREQEPQAEVLYREATPRFVELVNGFQESLAAVPGLANLPPLDAESGFRARSRFHYTEMLAVAPSAPGTWFLDVASPRGAGE